MSIQPGDHVTVIPWSDLIEQYTTRVTDYGETILEVNECTYTRNEIQPFEGFVFEVSSIDFDGEVLFTEDNYEEFDDFGLRMVFFTEDVLRDIKDRGQTVSSAPEIDIDAFLAIIM